MDIGEFNFEFVILNMFNSDSTFLFGPKQKPEPFILLPFLNTQVQSNAKL